MLAPTFDRALSDLMRAQRHARTGPLLLLHGMLVVGMVGCGIGAESGAHLQGKVTIDGQEIPADAKAHIMFAPESASDAETASAPIVGGRYDCANVPLGPVTAYFEITRAVGPMKRSERTGAEYQDIVNLVPAERSTGIRLEVTGDNASQDFDL